MGPSFKASEGEGTVAKNRGPSAGVQVRVGEQGEERAMSAADMGERGKGLAVSNRSVEWRTRHSGPGRNESWGSSWIV